jgi:hypothetical protein
MHLLQKQFFALGSNFKQSSSYGPVIYFFGWQFFAIFVRNILKKNILTQIPCCFFSGKTIAIKQKIKFKIAKNSIQLPAIWRGT